MQTTTRNGKKWTVTETLALQREYELLGLSVQEIAQRHNRSERAILFKVENEGWERPIDEQTDSTTNELSLEESNEIRIYKLEFAMEELSNTISDIMKFFSSGKSGATSKTSR